MPPQLPADLLDRYAKGEVVLFVGAGMSQPALPGWGQLLKNMIVWAEGEKIDLGREKSAILDLIERQKLLLAAQTLRERLQASNFVRFMKLTFAGSALKP